MSPNHLKSAAKELGTGMPAGMVPRETTVQHGNSRFVARSNGTKMETGNGHVKDLLLMI